MTAQLRNFLFACLGLLSGVFAIGQIHVENPAVGDRMLILTLEDSVLAPDLSKLQVEGYEIENAVFIEEMNPQPTRFAPNYMDLTLPGNGRIVDYVPTPGTIVIELPATMTPLIGTILADTAFGGLLRKVVTVDGQPTNGLTGRRWVLKTEEANLPEAVLDCDLSFKTRLDLNQALEDESQDQEVVGESADGTPAYGRLGFSLKGAQVLFQPTVTGRIRIRNGRVELFQFLVTGNCEVMANLSGNVTGNGNFDYEEELTGKRPTLVSLGAGLFIKVQNRPFFRMETISKQGLSAQGSFRIQNALKGELGFTEGQWRPLAENKMTFSEQSVSEIRGDGEIKMSLKPRVEVLLEGVQGPVFTFDPYARFSSIPDPIVPPPTSITALPNVLIPPTTVGSSGAVVPIPGVAIPTNASTILAVGNSNKQLSLGSNIYMEMRSNFIGPAAMRSFLLFNREQMVLSPPREGTLVLKEADSSRIALQCQTFPKADYYIIQQKLGAGPWEVALDRSVLPKIRINSLKPSSQYRFRAIGVNAMGSGLPFPPEGIAFISPAPNLPPLIPALSFPDSGSVVSDSGLTLTWKGGDPDLGAKVTYTVILDTQFPPLAIQLAGVSDTTLQLTGMKPGQTYYWKILASDGTDRSESPIRSFTLKVPAPVVKLDPVKLGAELSLAFVPKGSYRRQDGKLVLVGPFFLGKNEVTQSEFQKVMGSNPSYRFYDSLPVERVTWEEADNYCRETGGRLPTEAEWEYAARAGSSANFYWGGENPGDYAWYRENSDNRTQKVGLKKPNSWGLHDMAGNVFEWVQDWYGDYSPNDLDHPKGPTGGTAKVIRGASWYSESANLSLASRYSNRPGFRNFKVGFRCAKEVDRVVLGNGPGSAFASKGSEPAGTSSSDVEMGNSAGWQTAKPTVVSPVP